MSTRPKRKPGETRELVEQLRRQGCSYRQISERLAISKGSVAYHCRNLGVPPDARCARRYGWAEILSVYESGLSARACMKRFGVNRSSWADAVRRGDIRPRERRTRWRSCCDPTCQRRFGAISRLDSSKPA